MLHTAQFCNVTLTSFSSLDVSLSPSDSHSIAECHCLCQRSKQAFTFKFLCQELPRLGGKQSRFTRRTQSLCSNGRCSLLCMCAIHVIACSREHWGD